MGAHRVSIFLFDIYHSPTSKNLHLTDVIFQHAAVATDNKVCSNVGSDILAKNGSAVDSAIASMLCLGE